MGKLLIFFEWAAARIDLSATEAMVAHTPSNEKRVDH